MTREELEKHEGPVWVLRNNVAERADLMVILYDGLCKVRFTDNSIAWEDEIDIYPSRRDLLLAWETNLMNQRDNAIRALENCRAQICAVGQRILFREALKIKCAEAESGDE